MKYLSAHIPIVFAYSLILSILMLIRGKAGLELSFLLDFFWIFLGVLVGTLLLFLDRVVYTYSYPQEQLSQHFVYLWKQKSYGQALGLLYARRSEQQKLTFRSALFISIWIPLAFFALTSTTALFGKGVVMGLMLHILYDSWRLQRMDSSRLNTRLFWQISRPVNQIEQATFLWAISGLFVVFSFWLG